MIMFNSYVTNYRRVCWEYLWIINIGNSSFLYMVSIYPIYHQYIVYLESSTRGILYIYRTIYYHLVIYIYIYIHIYIYIVGKSMNTGNIQGIEVGKTVSFFNVSMAISSTPLEGAVGTRCGTAIEIALRWWDMMGTRNIFLNIIEILVFWNHVYGKSLTSMSKFVKSESKIVTTSKGIPFGGLLWWLVRSPNSAPQRC